MRSSIYILMFLASLAVVSCAKQEIRPTENVDAYDTPTWRSSETGEGNTSGGDIVEGAGILDPDDDENVTGDNGDGVIDGTSILDPENDPNKKKKKGKE